MVNHAVIRAESGYVFSMVRHKDMIVLWYTL